MTFEEWWASQPLAKESAMPLILRAFKETAEAAWNASRHEYVPSWSQAIKDAAADISTMMPSGMQHGTGTYERWVEAAIRRSFERHGISPESSG